MTTPTARPRIAPPGARCQVCGGLCGGAAVEAGPGPDGTIWYIHREPVICAIVALLVYRGVRG